MNFNKSSSASSWIFVTASVASQSVRRNGQKNRIGIFGHRVTTMTQKSLRDTLRPTVAMFRGKLCTRSGWNFSNFCSHHGRKNQIETFGCRGTKMGQKSCSDTLCTTGATFCGKILASGQNFRILLIWSHTGVENSETEFSGIIVPKRVKNHVEVFYTPQVRSSKGKYWLRVNILEFYASGRTTVKSSKSEFLAIGRSKRIKNHGGISHLEFWFFFLKKLLAE